MKILHVETGQNLYGGALQVKYLIHGLQKKGVENILVCSKKSKMAQQDWSKITCYIASMDGDMDMRFIFRLRKIIKKEQPDVVHLHSRRGADTWGAIAARTLKIPVILSRRVDNPEWAWIVKLKYRLYAHVITISEEIRKILIKEGVAANKISCIPSAVDWQIYAKSGDQNWFEQEFNLPAGKKVFAIIAQFIPRKGHWFLFEAIPKIIDHDPNVQILCFGQGPMEDMLKQQCYILDLTEHIHFAGFRPDLDRILPCLYGVIHPALMEGLGVSLLQAAAAGLPIVATDVGGIPEIVKNNKTGLLIPAQDHEALATAVIRLLDEPNLAKNLGQAGRQKVKDQFSIEAMVNGNLSIYQRILPSR